jgi:hypothetical protein
VTFLGVKDVSSPTARPAARPATREAMTMSRRILDGWVGPDDDAPELATGLLWMMFRDVAAQLAGVRADVPSLRAEAAGLARYGALFAGRPMGRRGAQGADLRAVMSCSGDLQGPPPLLGHLAGEHVGVESRTSIPPSCPTIATAVAAGSTSSRM